MTEAVRAILRFGFEEMKLNRISAALDPENHASAHVLEKVGMTHEGTAREEYFIDGQFSDTKMYAILRREWQSA